MMQKEYYESHKEQFEYAKFFIKFLNKKNALHAFLYNLQYMRKYNPTDCNHNKILFSKEGFENLPKNFHNLIVHSFAWDFSKELYGKKIGWFSLNTEWVRICNMLKNESNPLKIMKNYFNGNTEKKPSKFENIFDYFFI